jgi:hypothetical protein
MFSVGYLTTVAVSILYRVDVRNYKETESSKKEDKSGKGDKNNILLILIIPACKMK